MMVPEVILRTITYILSSSKQVMQNMRLLLQLIVIGLDVSCRHYNIKQLLRVSN